MKPRSINIFLLDGDPNGIRVAQISMSTIQAIAFRPTCAAPLRASTNPRRRQDEPPASANPRSSLVSSMNSRINDDTPRITLRGPCESLRDSKIVENALDGRHRPLSDSKVASIGEQGIKPKRPTREASMSKGCLRS